MRTDQCTSRISIGLEWLDGERLRCDGIINHVVWHNAKLIEHRLRSIDVSHVFYTCRIAVVRFVPVKFFFGMNHYCQDRFCFRWQKDQFAVHIIANMSQESDVESNNFRVQIADICFGKCVAVEDLVAKAAKFYA